MMRALGAIGAVLTVSFIVTPAVAAPWIQQDRWMVLGPFENPDGCLGDMSVNLTPGHDLSAECPEPGDDWKGGLPFIDGALTWWTPLEALGIGPADSTDLAAYADELGLKNQDVAAIALVYAINLTSSPIQVQICTASDDAMRVQVNDQIVTRVPDCRGTAPSCAEVNPAVLLPGQNKIAATVWQGGFGWGFRMRLLRLDGTVIDDALDPEVEFTLDPSDCLPAGSPFRTVRSIQGLHLCPVQGTPPATVAILGNGQGNPDEAVTIIERLQGQAVVSEISNGGIFAPAPPLSPCEGAPLPPGVLARFLDIDFPCTAGKTTLVEEGVYDVVGAGADIWADGDQFQFAYAPLRGDFSITARIAERDWGGPSPPAQWGKFGLMVRQDCSYRSRYAFVHDSPDPDPLRFAERPTHGGVDNFDDGFWPPPDIHPDFLRMDRVGDTFVGYASSDGKSWTRLHEMRWEPPVPCEVLVGLAVTSHAFCEPVRIRFDQVAVKGGHHECPPPPPAGGTITWNLKRSEVNQGLSYSVAGRGWIDLAGDDGLHAIEGESRIHLALHDPLGPELPDSLDIGPIPGTSGSPPGSTTYDGALGIYTQVGSGFDIWEAGDSFQFAFKAMSGDFDVTARVLEREDPSAGQWGRHGLMARQDCSAYSRYSMVYEYLGQVPDSPRFQWRTVHGVSYTAIELIRSDYPPEERPDFLRLLRRGDSMYGFLSRDGSHWEPVGSSTWQGQDPSDPVTVGFFTQKHESHDLAPVVKFQILHLGAVDPPLPSPFDEDQLSAGSEVFSTSFDSLGDFQVQSRPSGSEPKVVGGRLGLQEQGVTGLATSAFRRTPLEEIDSRVFQFEFDVFLKADGGEIPADGLAFVMAGGPDPSRVGLEGGNLGYTALGMEDGAGNRSTNSFAVEFDTWQNDWTSVGGIAYATDGPGSPAKPRTYHLGIDAANTVDSVVQTAEDLPDLFDPAGVHARVRYNRGRVTVWLASNAAGAGPLKQYLQADVLPLSFGAPDQRAVFGFTAATGGNTETGEVDNLKVTVFGCDDPREIAAIAGAPSAPVAQGALVTLDGSGSASGPGETGGITAFSWEVVSGPAAVEGPADQAAVNLRAGAVDGPVRVRLTASDGRCSNPGVAQVSFEVGTSSGGSWLRCDSNGDGTRDLSDPVFVLDQLFLGGPAPGCAGALDCNSDGTIDVSDVVFDLTFQFLAGDPPAPPYPGCDRFQGCRSICQ